MIRLVRGEFVKLRTTQVWFWLLLASIAITVVGVVAQIASESNDKRLAAHVRDIFTTSTTAYIALFVLGVLSVTTEFRYQTITPTVLATPSRWRLVSAKMITYAITGAAYAIVCVAVQLAVALPWLHARHIPVVFHDQIGGLLAVFGVVSLMGLVGLGAGALIKNQIVAVSVGVIFLLVVENLFLLIPGVKHIYPYLPGGAITAMTARMVRSERVVNGVHVLPVWGGVVTLLVWALAMAIIGAGFTMNRDIT